MSLIFDPSLVLYLPLHELDGASFMSRDKHGRLGTIAGAAWRPCGRSFDGIDDKITLPDDATLTPATGSILAWINQSAGAQYVFSSNTNQLSIYRNSGVNDNLVDLYYASAQKLRATTAKGDWAFIAFTFTNGGTGATYVNGVSQQTGISMGAGAPVHSGSPILGARSDSALYFAGTMGELLIYSRVLTASEIQRNYLETKWRYR